MAGIIDTLGASDPLLGARTAARERLASEQRRLDQQFQSSLQGADKNIRRGAVLGRDAFRLYEAITGAPSTEQKIEESPEVAAVKSAQALAKQLQDLGGTVDVGSAEYAAKAGQLAKAAGRDDIALQFAAEASNRRKAEEKLVADKAQKELENKRAAVNTLPSAQKLSLIVNDPDEAGKLYGLEGKQLQAFVKDADDTLTTMRKKNAAELAKVDVVTPINTSKADVDQTIAVLTTKGFDKDAFDTAVWGDGSDNQLGFAAKLTEQAKLEQKLRAEQGDNVTLDIIIDDIMTDIQQQELFVPHEEIDGAGISDAFRLRLDSMKATPSADGAPRKREGVLKL